MSVTGTNPFQERDSISRVLGARPKKPKRKLPHRMTYYLPEEVCQELKRVAQENGVPVSDVARYALEEFLRRYEAGQIDLTPKVQVVRAKLY